jgi:hypothetical protein
MAEALFTEGEGSPGDLGRLRKLLLGRIVAVERDKPDPDTYSVYQDGLSLTLEDPDGGRVVLEASGWGYDASGLVLRVEHA